MVDETESCPWEQVEMLLAAGDAGQLSGYLKDIPGGEVARCFSRLSSENVQQVLTLLDGKDAADIVEQLPESFSADILAEMEGSVAAQVLEQMPSNERADVLSEMDRSEAAAILEEMKPAAAADAMALSLYAPEVAGGLMITEYLRHYEDVTVDDVVRDFRQHAEQYSDYDVQYTYIVTREEVLVGVLRLRDLLLAPRRKTIAEIMIRQPLQVSDRTPLTALGDFFEEHPLMGVPITDDRGRLIGVVRREDVNEALLERSDRDYLKSQGIVSGEELRSMSIWRRSSRRLSWLSINIVLNILAASVIAAYQDTLAAVIALAVFLPIISDMSGCSGNQAVAVSIRELSLGLIRPRDVVRVWSKELAVGLINGVVLGAMLGFAAWLWKGNVFLGLVVAGAMAINTLVAVSIGGMVPLFLKGMKADPALASGPILTTITDMCGFLLILSLATVMLSRLA